MYGKYVFTLEFKTEDNFMYFAASFKLNLGVKYIVALQDIKLEQMWHTNLKKKKKLLVQNGIIYIDKAQMFQKPSRLRTERIEHKI